MPTYDYRCGACGEETEVFQSITAAPLKKCRRCGKPKLKRLIGTGAGIIFKGSGFYETDYRSDSYKKAAKADSGASTGTKTETTAKSDSSAKSESKPATAKDSGKKAAAA